MITQFRISKKGWTGYDFDHFDKRRRWEYVADSKPAPILARGSTTGTLDFAGLVTRASKNTTWNTRHYGINFQLDALNVVCFKTRGYNSSGFTGQWRLVGSGGFTSGPHSFTVASSANYQSVSCQGVVVPATAGAVQMQFSAPFSWTAYMVDEINVYIL